MQQLICGMVYAHCYKTAAIYNTCVYIYIIWEHMHVICLIMGVYDKCQLTTTVQINFMGNKIDLRQGQVFVILRLLQPRLSIAPCHHFT